MIGVVIVAHGGLAKAFAETIEQVLGAQERFEAIAVHPEDDLEKCRETIIRAVENVNTGSGVAILTDMFGAAPANLAYSVMNSDKIRMIAGVNLPLLIKFVSVRGVMPLAQAVTMALEAGQKYMDVPERLLQSV